MSVKVGKLYKNKIVRDLNGNIVDWFNEADGGWIVQKRQIVNKDKWDEYVQREKDKAEAAKAATMQKVDPKAPDRTGTPSQIDELKQEMTDFKKDVDTKFDAIMKALKK